MKPRGFVACASLLGLALLALAPVRADQCWSTTAEQTRKAYAALHVGDVIVQYCEPCKTAPAERITIRRLTEEEGINGRGLPDLAYLFVPEQRPQPKSGPARFVNLAKIAGCPTHDVSPALTFDVSKLPESSDMQDVESFGEEDE